MASGDLALILGIPPSLLSILLVFFIILAIWESIWKSIGMWKAARNNQLAWFICILVFNTLGILPLVYIYFFQKKKEAAKKVIQKKKAKKK